jgi:hypothetical protein
VRAIVKHTEKVYDALLDASTKEDIDGDTMHIYRGQVAKLYQTLGIPQSYYTEIFTELRRQECIINLQRGSRNVNTVILLQHPPEAGDFSPKGARDLTSAEDSANLREMILLHDKLIGGMDIVGAFKNVEERLLRLEQLAGTQENSVSKQ